MWKMTCSADWHDIPSTAAPAAAPSSPARATGGDALAAGVGDAPGLGPVVRVWKAPVNTTAPSATAAAATRPRTTTRRRVDRFAPLPATDRVAVRPALGAPGALAAREGAVAPGRAAARSALRRRLRLKATPMQRSHVPSLHRDHDRCCHPRVEGKVVGGDKLSRERVQAFLQGQVL